MTHTSFVRDSRWLSLKVIGDQRGMFTQAAATRNDLLQLVSIVKRPLPARGWSRDILALFIGQIDCSLTARHVSIST